MRLFLRLLLIFAFLTAADASRERISFGQKNLSAMIEISGGFNGKIFLDEADSTSEHERSEHERWMLSSLTELVPNENVITAIEIVSRPKLYWSLDDANSIPRKLKEHGIRVVQTPSNTIIIVGSSVLELRLQALKDIDALNVHSVGNISTYPHSNIYHQEDPYWGPPVDGDISRRITAGKAFQEIERYFQEGHSILASYALEKPRTFEDFIGELPKEIINTVGDAELKKMYQNADKYIRHPHVIRFGDLKEYGFTVLVKHRFVAQIENRFQYPSGSFASTHVSVFAFYLFQLWDTTAEVVEVMQKTAIDIGEPGPDEEFGWGLINADHPIIWNRGIERLQQSLSFCLLEDVAFEEAITITSKNEGFDIFHDIRSDKREVGLTYNKGRTTLAFTTGSAQGPFGLTSRFLQQQQHTFLQFGVKHSLVKNASLIGVFGRSHHEDVKVNKGSLGINYQGNFSDKGDLSLYAGYRTIWGNIGLPGYKTVGVSQIPFALYIPEVRASFRWFF